MRRLALAFCLWLAALAGTPAASQVDPGAAATRAAERLDTAARQLAAAESARDRVRALTETIRAFEEGMSAMRESLRRATLREGAIRERFEAEAGRLGQLIGVLQTIQGTPEATLLLHPDGALGTVRSGLLIADVTPALAAEAERLRQDLTELQTLRALQESAASRLQDGLAGLQAARVALSQAMSERRDLPQRFTDNPEQLARLIEGAETLSAFATSLAELPDDPDLPTLPDFADARGDLAWPVRGALRHAFQGVDAAGIQRPGWVIETAPGALVTAPWPATVRYAGPLLDYGNVIVLEPSSGYLLVLAGLGTVYDAVGDIVAAGRPLGLMPGAMAGGYAQAALQTGDPERVTLYVEVRQDGAPEDPDDWFRDDEELRSR